MGFSKILAPMVWCHLLFFAKFLAFIPSNIFVMHDYFCLSSPFKILIKHMLDCLLLLHSFWTLRSVFLFASMRFICLFSLFSLCVSLWVISSWSILIFTDSFLCCVKFNDKPDKGILHLQCIHLCFSYCHLLLMISTYLLKFLTYVRMFSTFSTKFFIQYPQLFQNSILGGCLSDFDTVKWFFSLNDRLFSLCLCNFLIDCQITHAK